jgi:hypothetical protein
VTIIGLYLLEFITYVVQLWSKLDNVVYHVKRKQKPLHKYIESFFFLGRVVITYYSFVLTCFVLPSGPQGAELQVLTFPALDLFEEAFIFHIFIA